VINKILRHFENKTKQKKTSDFGTVVHLRIAVACDFRVVNQRCTDAVTRTYRYYDKRELPVLRQTVVVPLGTLTGTTSPVLRQCSIVPSSKVEYGNSRHTPLSIPPKGGPYSFHDMHLEVA